MRVAQLHDEETQSTATSGKRVLKWVAVGYADPIAAENACRAEAPPYYKDLPLVDVSAPKFGASGWTFTFTYSATFEIAAAAPPMLGPPPPGPPVVPPPPPPGVPPPPPTPTAPTDSTTLGGGFGFTVGGGTVKLLRSFKTVLRRTDADLTAPNLNRYIGVTAQGSIEGVEVPSPKFEWSFSCEPRSITLAYRKTLRTLVGRTNRATFYTLAPENCFLAKVTGQFTAGERWKLTYDFWDSYDEIIYEDTPENRVAHPDAEFLPENFVGFNVSKVGWHYLWFATVKKPVTAGGLTIFVEEPKALYVDQVFRTADFSKLEIGA